MQKLERTTPSTIFECCFFRFVCTFCYNKDGACGIVPHSSLIQSPRAVNKLSIILFSHWFLSSLLSSSSSSSSAWLLLLATTARVMLHLIRPWPGRDCWWWEYDWIQFRLTCSAMLWHSFCKTRGQHLNRLISATTARLPYCHPSLQHARWDPSYGHQPLLQLLIWRSTFYFGRSLLSYVIGYKRAHKLIEFKIKTKEVHATRLPTKLQTTEGEAVKIWILSQIMKTMISMRPLACDFFSVADLELGLLHLWRWWRPFETRGFFS